MGDPENLKEIKDFKSLVNYLKDELDWPIDADSFDELTFDYEAEELGIDAKTAAKIDEIKQLRPLVTGQPWGIFFIKFEPKRLPVIALRRILSTLVVKKKTSGQKSEQATWNLHDLLFISNYGEGDQRQITLAHFSQDETVKDLPTLRVLGWDEGDTILHLTQVEKEMKDKLRWPKNSSNLDEWRKQWSSAFTLRHKEVITTSKDLAIRLADLAKKIRGRIKNVLEIETENGPFRKLYRAFKTAFMHDLDEGSFSDMYAQTLTYGLLSARVSQPESITADKIADMARVTNPFLKELLSTFLTAGGRREKIDFDEIGINDVVQALRDANMGAVLRDFGNKNLQEDPVVHFYELFLKEYNPEIRLKRGVFYTPKPIVSYIVRNVHYILKTEFGLEDGLADIITWGELKKRDNKLKIPEKVKLTDPFVQILDPATGTGTFLVEVIDVVHETLIKKWKNQGKNDKEIERLWNEYVPRNLLPRLYGFELMMAPYVIAHMKIGLKLHETGYHFQTEQSVKIFLTNTLEPATDSGQVTLSSFSEGIAHEALRVNNVKHNKYFTIIIGNPPYSVSSSNKSEWILEKIKDYKTNLKEQNIQPLNDDYIKFIRFAQWRIAQNKQGILGFITNNSYLDGVIHRQMRKELLKSFNQTYILNLHGDSRKKEVCPDCSKDENVFNIQQGVAIGLFIMNKNIGDKKIFYSDLYGLKEKKYDGG